MTPRRVPGPDDITNAAKAAAESAQSAVGDAVRASRASIELAGQLPDLIENLVVATERLNRAIDRAERYLALADPMIRTMDSVLPQLEALVNTGTEVFEAVSTIPGVSTLNRFTGRGGPAAGSGKPPRTDPKKR